MLILGIDTGGTYTDGVIMERETGRVLCTAKALTTHHELTIGMEACMRALEFSDWEKIAQVSLSTTLATNAIVEDRGGRVGVIVLGRKPVERLPAAVCVALDAQVDIRGGEQEQLSESALQHAILQLQGKCDAVAVSGYASVRNPAHELEVAQAVRERLGLPVVCGHELTGALGFYERTVTAALNAGLIPILRCLITTVYWVMNRFGIQAPIYIVRGDGSLMRADYAMERPVETVLSGPAASVAGARFLSGQEECVVVDIGGTTTDIAYMHGGRCRVTAEGAQLSGWRTRVHALAICTYGLGGDSAICIDEDGVRIGSKRALPFCRAEEDEDGAQLTPTDLLHITGEYCRWDAARAQAGLQRLCGSEPGAVERLRGQVVDCLAGHCAAGMQALGATSAAVLVGVGAPACTWLAPAAAQLGLAVAVPEYAEVANAVGAAIGQVYETAHAFIRRNKANGTYYIYTAAGRQHANMLAQAEAIAQDSTQREAAEKARRAGAQTCQITAGRNEMRAENGELIEIRLQATACGYPT